MNLQTTQQNLPTTIEDLSKFVLVGREKLIAVKAEIRAINKVELATEVRDQKRDEARMLSEALLDAEMRIGEITKTIPKAIKGNQYTGKMVSDSGVGYQTSKKEVVEKLGLNMKQVERFETLANNPDIVEQVKAEARENDDLPTRTQVISLAKEKVRRAEMENRQLDEDEIVYKRYRKACKGLSDLRFMLESSDDMLALARFSSMYSEDLHDPNDPSDIVGYDAEIEFIDRYIDTLKQIKGHLLSAKAKGVSYGKK